MANEQEAPNAVQADGRLPLVRVDLNRDPGLHAPWSSSLWAVAVLVITLLFAGVAAATLFVFEGAPLALRGAKNHITKDDPGPADIILRQLRELHGRDPAQLFMLHSSIGHIFLDEGRYAAAATHYTAALELGTRDEDRIALQHSLGRVWLQQGRLSEARRQLEEALTLTEPHVEQAFGILYTAGDVRREMGHLSDAIVMYNKARELGSAQGSANKELLPLLAADIADARLRQGVADQALLWLRRATELQSRARKGQSQRVEKLNTAKIQSFVAAANHVRGSIADAMELYRNALTVQTLELRPSHPDLVSTRMNMARAQRDLGDHSGALRTIEAVELILRGGPQEGLDLSQALTLKAELMREATQYANAEIAIQEAFRLYRDSLGNEVTPALAVALNTYGSILHDEGKFNEALQAYKQALEVNMNTVGPHHPETAATHNSLGTLFEDSGDDTKAEEQFLKCLEIQLHSVGEASPDVANSYNNLATILFRKGMKQEAARLLEKAVKVMENAGLPKDNPDRALYEDNLAELLKATEEQVADGEPLAEAAMAR